MERQLFEIWEDKDLIVKSPQFPWRAQMPNHVARFPTEEAAQRFVDATKAYRKKHNL